MSSCSKIPCRKYIEDFLHLLKTLTRCWHLYIWDPANLLQRIWNAHRCSFTDERWRKPLNSWLKLNHCNYYDLDIAYDNLDGYPVNGPPVTVTYRSAVTNQNPDTASAFDHGKEEGVDSGKCPFVVN